MKIENSKLKINKGFSLVETIVAVSVAAFSILAVWQVYTFFIKLSLSNPALFQASFLAEEGIEAAKFMRDSGWDENIATLASNQPYHLVFDGTGWKATSSAFLIDNRFDRQMTIYDVYRDSNGNIADSGALDGKTKKITVAVSWQKDAGATTTKEISTYVSNIFEN